MDTSPIAVAHAWIDAANRQDFESLIQLSDPEIEITGPRGSVRGTAILRDWLQRAGLTLENKRTFAGNDLVVIEQHGVWRSLETGQPQGEADVASRFRVSNGRITAFQRHDDLRSALAAAGLEET